MRNETRNKEAYIDTVPFEIIDKDEAERKSFYVFQTIFSTARLAGYQVKGDLTLIDWSGREHTSRNVMPKYKHKKNV